MTGERKFIGDRSAGEARVMIEYQSGGRRDLPLRLEVRDHSPTGFEWGNGGSGPSQLALAIICELVGEERALDIYMRFKFEVIGRLPWVGWELKASDILEWVRRVENDETTDTISLFVSKPGRVAV